MEDTKFIHSFPRPKKGESDPDIAKRALEILALIKNIGFVLAPEIIEWNSENLALHEKPLRVLQRRMCFTEIGAKDLEGHAKKFGPIALAFDKLKLRESGAMPVMYIPQGMKSGLSELASFCVKGAFHTRGVLTQLQQLKNLSNPAYVEKEFKEKVEGDFDLNLRNVDSGGKIISPFKVSASLVRQVLENVGYNNIPFDHSIGVLSIFLNMFYHTDNLHEDEELGYYRQREWRLIGGDIYFNDVPLGRNLTDLEKGQLQILDPDFWNRNLVIEGESIPRKDLALIYEPYAGWKALDQVEAIYAPENMHSHIVNIVGDEIPILTP